MCNRDGTASLCSRHCDTVDWLLDANCLCKGDTSDQLELPSQAYRSEKGASTSVLSEEQLFNLRLQTFPFLSIAPSIRITGETNVPPPAVLSRRSESQ